ncbi:MAG: histidine kinase [Burkholderiales bacterium]
MRPNAVPPAPFAFTPWRTLRFAAIVGAGFTVLTFALSAGHPSWHTLDGWARAIGTCLAFSALISFTIDLLFAAGARLMGPRYATLTTWQRGLFHWGTPLVGLAISVPIGSLMIETDPATPSGPQLRTTPFGAIAFMLLVTAIFYGYFAIRARQLRAERQAAEAQLRLLQAQMEPHFLFNTLANVVSLMDADTPRAKAMLESFTDYLRASLGSLRQPEHTLGEELDLIDAYLRVVKTRMDDRLSYRIDVAPALRASRLPALSVQPLVENAIVHGLEPSVAGGSVTIAAQLDEGRLVVRVTDDGLGLDATRRSGGTGTALNNLRERLQRAHGVSAVLSIEPVAPHGVRATLSLPHGAL